MAAISFSYSFFAANRCNFIVLVRMFLFRNGYGSKYMFFACSKLCNPSFFPTLSNSLQNNVLIFLSRHTSSYDAFMFCWAANFNISSLFGEMTAMAKFWCDYPCRNTSDTKWHFE